MYFGDNMKFAPRLGVVYDPRGNGQETIRAGFGMFYDTVSLGADQNSSAPWSAQINIPNPTSMENPFTGPVYFSSPYPAPNPFPSDYVFPQFSGGFNSWRPHKKPTYMLQWNLALQKQLPGDWLLSASYLGNRSLHTDSNSYQFNPVIYIPGTCAAGTYGPASVQPAGPCSIAGNDNYRRLLYLQDPTRAFAMSGLSWDGDGNNANYNGLITSVQKRFTQSYTILVNHTWSHCLTEAGGQDPYDRRDGYGPCTSDIRQQFNLSSVVSSPKFSGKAAQILAGNWKMSTIFTANTGPYSSPTTGTTVQGAGGTPNFVPGQSVEVDNPTIDKWFNTAAFSAPTAPVNGTCSGGSKVGAAFLGSPCYGTAGRGIIQGPGAWNINMSLSRNFNANVKDAPVQFAVRIEAFNVLNHTRFAPPVTNMNSADYGKILFANSPRAMQGSLKMTF